MDIRHSIDYFSRSLRLAPHEHEYLIHVVNLFPETNWKDALGRSQIISKRYLVDWLKALSTEETTIIMIGGWIGLIQYLMERDGVVYKSNLNIDLDVEACAASLALNATAADAGKFSAVNEDALKFDFSVLSSPLLVINTSCEHLADYRSWISRVPAEATCILQSNNMFGLEEHVNCQESLEAFVKNCGLGEIIHSHSLDIGNGWERYTVIGKPLVY